MISNKARWKQWNESAVDAVGLVMGKEDPISGPRGENEGHTTEGFIKAAI